MEKNSPVTYAALLIIVVIGFGVFGWYYVSNAETHLLDNKTLSQMPDVVASNIHLQQFDESGKLKQDLISIKMEHLPADDRYTFLTPIIQVREDGKQMPWVITAKHALTFHGAEFIELSESVKIHQQIDASQFHDILTDKLYYQPKKQFAHTDQPITFKQPGAEINAIGMEAELNTKHVKLLHQAQGAFINAKG